MSADPFRLLGLKRSTATERDVREAYAILLKQNRPDDDREGFMRLREAFNEARGIAKWNDQQREQGEAVYVPPEDTDDTEDATEAAPKEDAWYQDTQLNRWYRNGPVKPLTQKAIAFLMAGKPDGGAALFRELAADPVLDDLATFDTFSNEVRYSIGALLEELQEGQVPAWLDQPLAVALNEIFPWVKARERDPDTAEMNNLIKLALDPHLLAAGVIDAPLEKDDVIELRAKEMEAEHGDDHGSYYDRKAEIWVDMSPSAQAMRKIESLSQSPWAANSSAPWLAIIEDDELQTVDEFSNFAWRLRSFVCDRTGMGGDNQTPDVPDWLTLSLFLDLDSRFGWTTQASRDYWEREQNQWLYKVGGVLESRAERNREDTAVAKRAAKARRRFPQVTTAEKSTTIVEYKKPWTSGFGMLLRFVWILFLISAVVRYVLR